MSNENETSAEATESKEDAQFSRRQVLLGAGAGVVGGLLVGAGIDHVVDYEVTNKALHATTDIKNIIDLGIESPFYDQDHPAGIRCSYVPRYANFIQFDMIKGTTRSDLQVMLAKWSAAISLLMAGEPLGDIRPEKDSAVPKDSGECTDLYPANLSVVVGFGPSLFDDRFGLAEFKPAAFAELPRITDDRFDASQMGSDFGMWIKSDDHQVLFHAVRALVRIARGKATFKYTHQGYLSARQHGEAGKARGNHGFHVGLTGCDTDQEYNDYVWVSDSDQEWMKGGSYMVYRDTHFEIDTWDIDRIGDQEYTVGRRKDTGAPLSDPNGTWKSVPDYEAKDENGNYLIDPCAHIRLVDESYLGFKVMADGYRYWRGILETGHQDCGFVNVFFQNDLNHFFTMRDNLGRYDLVKEYYWDTMSGTYAVPHAPATGTYIGQDFFQD